jgi:hypothetical protein
MAQTPDQTEHEAEDAAVEAEAEAAAIVAAEEREITEEDLWCAYRDHVRERGE